MYDSQKKYQPRSLAGEAGRVAIWLVIVVLLVVAAGAWLVVNSLPEKQPIVDIDSLEAELEPSVPEQVYAYVGSVVSLDESSFELLAAADQNNLFEERQLTVVIDEQTSFVRLTIPSILPEDPAELSDLFKREDITFAELEVGDQVTAVSALDVRGSANFTASRVEVQVVK